MNVVLLLTILISRIIRFGASPLASRFLPALGLDVVDVGVLAQLDVGDRLADVETVLDDGVALLDVAQRRLVADRNVVDGFHLDRGIIFHDPADHLLAGLDAFDHGHADRVLLVMYQYVNHCASWMNAVRVIKAITAAGINASAGPVMLPAPAAASQLDDLYESGRLVLDCAP